MGICENPLVLYPQTDQCVDIEKTSIAEITPGTAPERQTIVLPLEQSIQPIDIRIGPRWLPSAV